jgi:hypothetical protein
MRRATDPLGLPPLDHELVLFAWRAASWQRVNMADSRRP